MALQWSPAWAWTSLFTAMLAVSAGGIFFALMPTQPITAAAWRLTATAAMQMLPALRQVQAHPELRQRWVRALPTLAAVGVILAVHFAAWAWSVRHTTLARSLLFVSTHPPMLVAAAIAGAALHRVLPSHAWCRQVLPTLPKRWPARAPVAGVLLAMGGTALLSWQPDDAADAHSASMAGDAAACLGAAAAALYLVAGASLRVWMPLWMYVWPLTAVAAVAAAVLALLLEDAPAGEQVAWMTADHRQPAAALLTLGAAAISGILGHTLVNAALRTIPAFTASMLLLVEAPLGALAAWALGLQAVPHWNVWVGGAILLAGCALALRRSPTMPDDPAAPPEALGSAQGPVKHDESTLLTSLPIHAAASDIELVPASQPLT